MRLAASIQHVIKQYVMDGETVHALRGVSFDVPEGDYVAIMGPSGSGKSTLLNLLGCLDRPTAGTILLGDDDVSRLNDDRAVRDPRLADRLRLPVVQPDPATDRAGEHRGPAVLPGPADGQGPPPLPGAGRDGRAWRSG